MISEIAEIIHAIFASVLAFASLAVLFVYLTRLFGARLHRLNFFTEHLLAIVKSNLPILTGLDMLVDDTRGGFSTAIDEVRCDVAKGNLLSDALERFPRIFPKTYVAIVRAGEKNGNLAQAFETLLGYNEDLIDLRRRAFFALGYPIGVCVVIFSILSFITIWIIPKFEAMFTEMGVELPRLTGAVFSIMASNTLEVNSFSLLIEMASIVWLGMFGLHELIERVGFIRHIADRIISVTPLLRFYSRSKTISRFSKTLGLLLEAGAPMDDAMEAATDLKTNCVFEGKLRRAKDGVISGDTLASQLRKVGGFPGKFRWMVSMGEESGKLPELLYKAGDFYQDKADRFLSHLSRLIFPAIILLLGYLVGSIVIAMFLPMVKLASELSQH